MTVVVVVGAIVVVVTGTVVVVVAGAIVDVVDVGVCTGASITEYAKRFGLPVPIPDNTSLVAFDVRACSTSDCDIAGLR